MKLLLVAGARPNFVKIAPLMWELRNWPRIRPILVHTGQHYDRQLSDLFFDELEIPDPDHHLGVGSGSHAQQTAEVMRRIEPVLLQEKPDRVIVVGDVNSTLAAALTAVKLDLPVAHVEAGLRSFDRRMPEETNRIVTDAISSWLFVSEQSGLDNLAREGAGNERIHFVGNVMIDTLIRCLPRIDRSQVVASLGLTPGEYCVLTLHRPSTVDDGGALDGVHRALQGIQQRMAVVFPVHPRTRSKLDGWARTLPQVRLVDPLGYFDFLKLVKDSRLVLTDSGGLQEETTFLGVPCVTLRENTERPVTVRAGTNRLVGLSPERITRGFEEAFHADGRRGEPPPLWDGKTAHRILAILGDSDSDTP